jgi:hypothetical protein
MDGRVSCASAVPVWSWIHQWHGSAATCLPFASEGCHAGVIGLQGRQVRHSRDEPGRLAARHIVPRPLAQDQQAVFIGDDVNQVHEQPREPEGEKRRRKGDILLFPIEGRVEVPLVAGDRT